MRTTRIRPWFVLCVALLAANSGLRAEDAKATLTLTSPISCQVFQRGKGDQADILIEGNISDKADVIEAKADLAPGAKRGTSVKWIAVTPQGQIVQGKVSGRLTLPAGGWYQVTVRARLGTRITAEQTVGKVGVGEVFITAGQSNSANYGNPRQEAHDDRVVYFDGKSFVHAKDPIPGGCGDGGSPWALLGDRITAAQQVPVCFRSASLTWTEVNNWLPGTALYKNLLACVKVFGKDGVRAVLWHQGESDTLISTPAATYCARLQAIIESLGRDCGYPVPWFVAQATYHPGSQPPQQREVAKGQRMLWEKKAAFPGPVTDDLLGEKYRHDGVHFNQAGLDAHAQRWFRALQKQYGWKTTPVVSSALACGAEDRQTAAKAPDLGYEFIKHAKFGIFVHYTVEYAHLSPGKPQPAVWDLDAKADAFDVKAFADAVEGMGAQYVTLTAFHAAMYLLAPSKVMVDVRLSKHQAKRDLIGELADELNKRGIALCLYVHPTDQHDLSREERALFGWGPDVNGLPGAKLGLWPNPKWDDFVLGLFKELSLQYGKRVSGYWIDQHTGKVFPDAGRLAVALRAGNPDAVIWQNSGAYVPAGLSLESAWPAAEGGDPSHGEKDQCCILPTENAWFLGKEVRIPVAEVFRGVVRCAGCPGQKGGVHVALTPYADAYAPKVKQMMDEFGKLWRERKVSLLNTRPSTILQIEHKSNPWDVVATDSADGSTVYVHVMIPPDGKTLHLPSLNDGRKLLDASILLGGKEVKFKQSEEDVELSLPEDVKWDPVDTVIVLKVGPAFEPGAILSENAKLEISSTCGYDIATNHARLFSGEKVEFAFHTDAEKNPWAKIDLGAVRTVRAVEIENRPGEQERIKGLILSISEDGQKWQEVWQAKSWASSWLVRLTNSEAGTEVPGRQARFIKLETRGESPRALVLKRVTVLGKK